MPPGGMRGVSRATAPSSVAQHAQFVAVVIGQLPEQIGRNGAPYLHLCRIKSEDATPQDAHFLDTDRVGCRRLLRVMDSEAGKKPRQTYELESGCLCPQDEIPVHREMEIFID